MTLLTALIGGLVCGAMLGWRRPTIVLWLGLWAAVLIVQTLFVVERDHVADRSYWPVQAGILLVGLGLLWLGAKLRTWRSRPPVRSVSTAGPTDRLGER